jgi:prolyl-tRNA synthetase
MEQIMSNKTIKERAKDYAEWYQDVVDAADLAEHSSVRGCMVIKPYGYAIWENMQKVLDKMIKNLGVKNVYFPLFIPKSFLSKEASHVEGFAKECAVITHYRLKAENGKVVVDPEAKLAEELIVRPTSETIIYDTFSRWIGSYRDLPLKINQWANVVRWEMRTRLFLRTSEFLWQEGHCAFASHDEAEKNVFAALDMYRFFAEEYLALPVFTGQKSESERFAGAVNTFAVEAMMQDGKALQFGTSHDLGQNFAKAFEIKFTEANGDMNNVWQTTWGVSTRMIGALIMAHSDDKGLVLPPKIAPIHVVVLPIYKDEKGKIEVIPAVEKIAEELRKKDIVVELDLREHLTIGEKFYEWEKKGVPVRIEVGARDLAKREAVVVRRDTSEKKTIGLSDLTTRIPILLDEIQAALYEKADAMRTANTHEIDDYVEFKKQLDQGIPGFILAHWCGSAECEAEIKKETKATTRCMPSGMEDKDGKCIKCGRDTDKRIYFAKAY